MDLTELFLLIGTIGGVISILFAAYLWFQVKKLSTGVGNKDGYPAENRNAGSVA